MAEKAADAYRTISEAGKETGLPAHVLRFWESKFSQLRPVKRAGGRRLYRPQDITLILGLKHLLYEEGFTIKGAQKYVKDHGVARLIEQVEQGEGPSLAPAQPALQARSEEPAPAPSDEQASLFEPAPRDTGLGADHDARQHAAIRQIRAAQAALNAVRKRKAV